MPIQVGQALPNATLYEFFDEETGGCSIGPNALQVSDLIKGKTIVIFGLPGAIHRPAPPSMYQALSLTMTS